MSKIYLTCIHDRHTDDVYKAFASEKDAKEHLSEMQKLYGWQYAQENQQYGDWCLWLSDDYYMFVEEVELIAEIVRPLK